MAASRTVLLLSLAGGAVAEPVTQGQLAFVPLAAPQQFQPPGMGAAEAALFVQRPAAGIAGSPALPSADFLPSSSHTGAGLEALLAVPPAAGPRTAPAGRERAAQTQDLRSGRPGLEPDGALRELGEMGEVGGLLEGAELIREFKSFWSESTVELNQFRKESVFEPPARPEAGQSGGRSGEGRPGAEPWEARPRSAEEIRRDAIQGSLLLRQLIEEIAPWLIGALLLYGSVRGFMAYSRLQGQRRLRRVVAAARPVAATGSGSGSKAGMGSGSIRRRRRSRI